jgi:hypothetical protein
MQIAGPAEESPILMDTLAIEEDSISMVLPDRIAQVLRVLTRATALKAAKRFSA